MLDKLLKELERLNGMKLSIPVEADENGYFDRECPDEDCMFIFKVHEDDWVNKFKDEAVFCPMCGTESTSDTFWTTEQIENAENQATDYIHGKIHKAIKEDARNFNRGQSKGGLISMSLSVKGHVPHKVIVPIPSIEVFEQRLRCKNCQSRYTVIGSAFFCPCCGHNSVEQTFSNVIDKIQGSIENIPTIKLALDEIDKDQSQVTCQSLVEKGLSDCVVAFQRYCDIMYAKHKNAKSKMPSNAFQKLDVGSALWKELLGEGYTDWMDLSDYERMAILFQRRHLLQHTEGIVDQRYIDTSNDTKYKLGQRIIVKESDVLELLGYVKDLTDKIREHTPDKE